MDESLEKIKKWLGTGSINLFGLPYAGKDTVGIKLAELLGAKFLSSGLILRAYEEQDEILSSSMSKGSLVPQDKFKEIVLPYFAKAELEKYPLILSSVGRWKGEESAVLEATENSGHPIKAVVLLEISEEELKERWEMAQILEDRGARSDDNSADVIRARIEEFRNKTQPVIDFYQQCHILVPVKASGAKDLVLEKVVQKLAEFSETRQ